MTHCAPPKDYRDDGGGDSRPLPSLNLQQQLLPVPSDCAYKEGAKLYAMHYSTAARTTSRFEGLRAMKTV